ncbi:MAG: hypothetical protein M1133_15345 [Armatimonadetes bacterium]|nr:hypothetical protein [Armatimonadota bacterium]
MGLKTLLVITITTARIIFPNVPMTTDASSAPNSSMASKSVTISLSSDKKTAEIPSAQVAVPEGLGMEGPVKLKVEFAEPKKTDEPAKDKSADSAKYASITYWGSTETVPPGQPKVVTSASDSSATTEPEPASYAYWPIGYRGEKTPKQDAKATGTYTLTTNYTGGASVTVDPEQEYMAPINVLSPVGSSDLSKPIKVQWEKVPKALGYFVAAYGGNDKGSITWTSSAEPNAADGLEEKAVCKKDLDGYIERKVLLGPDVTTITIPAGIFKTSNSVIITITAFGPDKIQSGDIESQVIVRSTLSLPLHTGVASSSHAGDKQ